MSRSFLTLVALAAFLFPGKCSAQEDVPPLRIAKVRIGFSSDHPEDEKSKAKDAASKGEASKDGALRMKVGMWAPVYVTLASGIKGYPEEKDQALAKIEVETRDSEDVATVFTLETRPLGPSAFATFTAYTRTGNLAAPVTVRLVGGGKKLQEETVSAAAPQLGSLLVLTLGAEVKGLQAALDSLIAKKETPGSTVERGKFSAHETEIAFLPDKGFGYDGVDLLVLCTGNADFLKGLTADPVRLGALSQYVRGGGHLVVSLAPANQHLVHDLLSSKAWQPPLPVVPPREPSRPRAATTAGLGGESAGWGSRKGTPFPAGGAATVFAILSPPKVHPGRWEVLAEAEDALPVIARFPCGLGQVTFIAFSLESRPFQSWEGRKEFLKGMVSKLTTKEASLAVERAAGAEGRDVAATLQRNVDQFDVPNLPFGLVALFMVLYLLFAGPLDYAVLRYVLGGRFEWTWLTFPLIVVMVTLAACGMARALKGEEQKINQVDLLEFDLRTDLDEKMKTRKAYVYGQSFFTFFSPKNDAYPVKLETSADFLGFDGGSGSETLTWFGRPDREAWGLGRAGSSGPLGKRNRAYLYTPAAAGLEQVPVPIWTTKSFRASWERALKKLPFEAQLYYHQKPLKDRDVKIRGTFKNNLPADLMDVWFISGDRCFQRKDKILASEEVPILFESHESRDLGAWAKAPDADGIAAPGKDGVEKRPAPTGVVKSILFFDKVLFGTGQNHLLRCLDQSWRLEKGAPLGGDLDPSIREVIVYARLRQRFGTAKELAGSKDQPLPTRLWLSPWHSAESTSPDLNGTLMHDTYIRIYLPLYPADK